MSTAAEATTQAGPAWWLSWYGDPRHGPFELHSPWWISGSTLEEVARNTIVGAVRAESEEAAREIVYASYDTRPDEIEFRFVESRDKPDYTPFSSPGGRFPRAEWMRWSE